MSLLANLKRLAQRDSAAMDRLPEFREALVAGRLHLCGNCQRFTFAVDPAEPGQCHLHGEALPFIPFACPEYVLTETPTAPRYSSASPFLTDAPA